MADIIEQAELETDVDQQDLSDLPSDPYEADQETITASLENPSEDTPKEDEIPEKYRGKSLQEVVGMHQEAEKLIGKHSGEVGELRAVVDQYVLKQLNADNTQHAPEPAEEVDFFENPEKAVQRAIDTHPAVQQANQAAQEMQHNSAMSQLQQRHPDMKEVLSDTKFADWVKASKVRTALFRQADQNYDAEVADELLTLYKERAGVAQQAMKQEQQTRKQQVKAASTGSTGQAGASTGKRVYRRADIIKLMKNDPDRYEALSPEIMQAYAEGRVR
jgi:hypothetical protein